MHELQELRKPIEIDKIIKNVSEIIERVKEQGDRALLEFTEKFDGVRLKSLKVKKSEEK